jgi:hypothetical protein
MQQNMLKNLLEGLVPNWKNSIKISNTEIDGNCTELP